MTQALFATIRRALDELEYGTQAPVEAAAKPGYITPHFSMAEMTHSNTGVRLGIKNEVPPALMANLKITCLGMEVVRTLLGNKAILVSSGFRSEELNTAVKGSRTSAHKLAYAVDFTCPGFGTPRQVADHLAKNLEIPYDQIIQEFGNWVHIGFGPGTRRELLTAKKVDGVTRYYPGIS